MKEWKQDNWEKEMGQRMGRRQKQVYRNEKSYEQTR